LFGVYLNVTMAMKGKEIHGAVEIQSRKCFCSDVAVVEENGGCSGGVKGGGEGRAATSKQE
jgi:hypothetical protein